VFLKDLAEIWKIYNRCSAWRLARSVYSIGKGRKYWYVWGSSLFYAAASTPIAFGEGGWFLAGTFLMVIAFFFLFLSVEKALQNEFPEEYSTHGLDSHPFSRRRLYLRYALFLKELSASGRTNEQIQNLLSFSKIADKPAPPFRLSEHPLILPIITILSVLSSEYIKDSEVWQAGNGHVFIFLIAMGALFLIALLDIVRGVKQKESELKRFLEWAIFDSGKKV